MTKIKVLPENIINQIAAGEVIDRPAGVVKELLENSIDSGANTIKITITNGGKSYISVEDDGCGMSPEDLNNCILRHGTSKIIDNDIFYISTLGFRGEALPSIGSVSNMSIISKCEGDSCYKIDVFGGNVGSVSPCAGNVGTKVIVKDLFFSTPARLKFLKSDKSETREIYEIVKKISLSIPKTNISLVIDGVEKLSLFGHENSLDRYCDLVGGDFKSNHVEIHSYNDNVEIKGYASIPSYSTHNSSNIFIFVNGRYIDDKSLITIFRQGYKETMPKGNFPYGLVFINVEPNFVDVNVHPTKKEVRFKNQKQVNGQIISSVKRAINDIVIDNNYSAVINNNIPNNTWNDNLYNFENKYELRESISFENNSNNMKNFNLNTEFDSIMDNLFYPKADQSNLKQSEFVDEHPLGYAIGQISKNYIISKTKNGMVIVDQHAAHERIVFEKYKKDFFDNKIQRQLLLIPVIVDVLDTDKFIITENNKYFEKIGFIIDEFAPNKMVFREIPSLLSTENVDFQKLVEDIIDEVNTNIKQPLENIIEKILAKISCYNSIRSGKILTINEMNELLRLIEKTPFSYACNHGRPTFLQMGKIDLENMFERT